MNKIKNCVKTIKRIVTEKPTYKHSIRQLLHSKARKRLLACLILAFAICWCNVAEITKYFSDNTLIVGIIATGAYALIIVFTIILLVAIMMDITSDKYSENLKKAGITNSANTAPSFIRGYRSRTITEQDTTVLEFDPDGTSVDLWNEHKKEFSNTFEDAFVSQIIQRDKRILVLLIDGEFTNMPVIKWENRFLSKDSSKVVLGLNEAFEEVVLDIDKSLHVKVGGMSGSGKTKLQQLILAQFLLHGDTDVYIADLKGRDYLDIWRNLKNCNVVSDIPETCKLISEVDKILDGRDKDFRNTLGKDNRKKLCDSWRRIVVVIEEATDLFKRPAGLKKLSPEDKDMFDEMQDQLVNIARKGRDCKVHLFINTQRPDAETLPKDLNSNLKYSLCGQADKILSGVVLGNTDAHEMIPKDKPGFFVNSDGELFQAYLLDDVNESLKDCIKEQ